MAQSALRHASPASTSRAKAGVSQSTVSLVLSGRPAAGSPPARRRPSAPRRPSSATGPTSRPARCARASRAASRSSCRTSRTRSSAACCAARSAPPSSAGYTVVLVDIGNNRAWEAASLEALLAGPADGLLLFEADLPPGTSEHAIQIEMCPGRPAGRAPRRRGGRGRPRSTICWSSATPDRPRRLRTSARRRSTCAASHGRRGWAAPPPTAHAPFTFERRNEAARALLERGHHRGVLRRRHPRRRHVHRRARARRSRSRRTCRSWASTTWTSRACSRRRSRPSRRRRRPRRRGLRGPGARPRGRPAARRAGLPVSCGCASRRRRRRVGRTGEPRESAQVLPLQTAVIRIMLIRMTQDDPHTRRPARGDCARAVRGLRDSGHADNPSQAVALVVAGAAANDPAALAQARGRRRAQRTQTERREDERRAARRHAMLAARGYDTVVTVGVDRHSAIAPVEEKFPRDRFVAARPMAADAAMSCAVGALLPTCSGRRCVRG